MPSAPRLRQRLDEYASEMLPVVYANTIDFLVDAKVPVSPLATGYVALDIDVFPMDNSGTMKEGVSRTYKGYDGYAPIAAYLGQEGWCLANELREGKQHSQNDFRYTLERVLPNARRLTDAPLLVRLDGGHDALETTRGILANEQADFILKWNPRQQDPEAWLARVPADTAWECPRPGKRVATFSVYEPQRWQGQDYRFRRGMRVTERTLDRHGQTLLMPQIDIDGWWTTLDEAEHPDATLIALYRDHATSEQFHSDKSAWSRFGRTACARRVGAREGAHPFKTDLDIERLPSGKFATNDLIMSLAAYSYNILRWIGLIGLLGDISPVRHPAKRRRWTLRFSAHCPAYQAFRLTYQHLAYG